MKKFCTLFLLVMLTVIFPLVAYGASRDEFLGVKFNATYDEVKGFIRGGLADGELSQEDYGQLKTEPSFNKGAQKIGGINVGSVFYVYDRNTKKLTNIYCHIEFNKRISSPKVENFNSGIYKSDYYLAMYPYSDTVRCYKEIVKYMEGIYGEPTSTYDNPTAGQHHPKGGGSTWMLFDQKITISVSWSEGYSEYESSRVDITIVPTDFPPDAEIFL